MEKQEDYSKINGWGIDADPENEPTYPIKKYTGDDHKRINWERPVLQQVSTELLRSNERPNISAVFGTSVPLKGLSGKIRRYAFKYSENSYGHWLPLLLADRVNVLEGIFDDLKKGRIPNIFAEKGWNAELKHNPKGIAEKALKGIAIAILVYALFSKKPPKWKKWFNPLFHPKINL